MKIILSSCIFMTFISLNAICLGQSEITGSDVRAILDGKFALTAEGYANYRKCIASIKLGDSFDSYTEALGKCKEEAKNNAFLVDQTKVPSSELGGSGLKYDERAWQRETLQRAK